ncbi:MAG: right-handed parallel beta-helix repeat-containing protein, partial [Thermoplasmata archaeon]|nr:right-handed parallel beta-helix repeat-containing protein [Thermoplasmata archaeon]
MKAYQGGDGPRGRTVPVDGEGMRACRVALAFLAAMAVLGVLIPAGADALTWIVDDDAGSWADFTTVGEALDASVAGDVILVYNGTYDENLLVDVAVSIHGNGSAVTTIQGNGTDNVTVIAANGVRMSGLRLVGSASNGFNAGIFVDADSVEIFDNECSGNEHGIFVSHASNVTVRGNVANLCDKNGIILYHSFECTVENSTCEENGINGIRLMDADACEVRWNTCDRNDEMGIVADTGSSDNHLGNNTVRDSRIHGIQVMDSDLNTLENNTIEGSGEHGIAIESSADTDVLGNRMSGCSEFGLHLSDTVDSSIDGNTASTDRWGFVIDDDRGSAITSNVCTGSYKNGVVVRWSDGTVLEANALDDNGEHGIRIYLSTSVALTDSRMDDNGEFGLHLEGSRDCIIEGNLGEGNRWGAVVDNDTASNLSLNNLSFSEKNGIVLRWCADTMLIGNDLVSNVEHGLRLYMTRNITIYGNRLIANGDDGLMIDEDCSDTSVSWNLLSGNGASTAGYGIRISSTAYDNLIHHNEFTDNDRTPQAYDDGSGNRWDDGSEGNNWSDYSGTDGDSDGIGDSVYDIAGAADAADRYPLMASNGSTVPEFDVRVVSLDLTPPVLMVGDIVSVEATVRNIGTNGTSCSFMIGWTGPKGSGTLVNSTTAELAPGDVETALASWNTTTLADGIYVVTAVADAEDSIAEKDEGNNVQLVKYFIRRNTTTIIVDDDGGRWAHFTSVQDALDSSVDGDTIKVLSGTYRENVRVSRTVRLLGNGTADATIDGMGRGNVLAIAADDCSVSGFSFVHSGDEWYSAGVYVDADG